MRVYYEFQFSEQPEDAFQKLIESMDDTEIWRGHLEIKRIDQNNRESILAFRKKKQIEWVGRRKEDLSIMIKYGDGPLKGYQIIQVLQDKILIRIDIKMRGLWYPFTRFAVSHILEGEINALYRLFPPDSSQERIK
ncbi:MAG: hypothetical protein QXU18_08130 [Thermoplasmatales archaeon]